MMSRMLRGAPGALLVGAILSTLSAAPRPPIGLVTELRGDVRLQRAGEGQSRPLGRTAFLHAGDRLQTGTDGHATLLQLHAPVAAIPPDRSLVLEALPPSTRSDALSPALLALLTRHFPAAARAAAEPSADVRRGQGDLVITLLAPRHNLVLEARPSFEWTRAPDASRYEVTLYDRGERVLWRTTTRGTRLTYPASRRPLPPGRYTWEVDAEGGSRSGLDTAPFTVATAAQAAAARRALARAQHLMTRGEVSPLPSLAVCLEHRLYPRAEVLLKQATLRAPNDPVLAAVAMRLYQLTGRWDERERTRPIWIGAQ
jgi:hypothetical protein